MICFVIEISDKLFCLHETPGRTVRNMDAAVVAHCSTSLQSQNVTYAIVSSGVFCDKKHTCFQTFLLSSSNVCDSVACPCHTKRCSCRVCSLASTKSNFARPLADCDLFFGHKKMSKLHRSNDKIQMIEDSVPPIMVK